MRPFAGPRKFVLLRGKGFLGRTTLEHSRFDLGRAGFRWGSRWEGIGARNEGGVKKKTFEFVAGSFSRFCRKLKLIWFQITHNKNQKKKFISTFYQIYSHAKPLENSQAQVEHKHSSLCYEYRPVPRSTCPFPSSSYQKYKP